MISSAVVIPEQDPEQRSPSPSLKRRQSSISIDSNKRPRLNTRDGFENGSQTNIESAVSPPSKRRSILGSGAAEEKKRGQRLFGALLGTLSQKSSKPVHKKRDEVEQKQRERLRKDTEQREEEQRRKREELDRLRRIEQTIWEEGSRRIRHGNMRAMAEFLQTKTEPKLYYKPWELREEEQNQIKHQIKEVEERIKDELDEVDADNTSPKDRQQHDRAESEPMHDVHDNDSGQKADEASATREEKSDQHKESSEEVSSSTKIDVPDDDGRSSAEQKVSEDERPKDDDHAGEELVEGQEDDVIY